MKLTRRALLAGGLFSTVSQLPFVRSAIARNLARPAIVLVCGVKPASDTAALRDGLTRLIDSGIPVAVAIDPFDETGAPMNADADVAVSVRDFAELHPRMVEVCGDLGDVAAGAPLEQIRRASDVQTALVAFMNRGDDSSPRPPVTATAVVTSTTPASAEDFRTMRAAGMRIAFHRPGDEAAEEGDTSTINARPTSTGLMNLVLPHDKRTIIDESGRMDFNSLVSAVDRAGGNGPIVLCVEVDAFSTREGLRNIGTLAGILSGAGENDIVRPMLPWNLYLRERPDDIRRIVLRFDGIEAKGGEISSLLASPALYALTPSVASDPPPDLADRDIDLALLGWVDRAETGPATFRRIATGARRAFEIKGRYPTTLVALDPSAPALLDAAANAGIRAISARNGVRESRWGMDETGILHFPDTVRFAQRADGSGQLLVPEVLSRLSSGNDAVLAIEPEAVSTAGGLRDLEVILSAVSDQQGTVLNGFEEYCEAVAPALHWVNKIQEAKAEVRVLDAGDGKLDEWQRARLLEDARLAWTFFEWGATQFTGMVPGTASRQGGGNSIGWPYATQWDIASYVNATVAARFLGLIDREAFDTTVSNILALILKASFDYAGVRLPNTEIGLGNNRTTARGYDSHDVGRLLIALGNLEDFAPERFPIAEVVGSWGLHVGIVDGLIHSIVGNGTFIDGHNNSYAHYIRNGFVRWGYEPLPVYPAMPAGIEGEVALISEVARRGRIATEALITEEVEVGGTDQIRLISDVLLAAQIRRHSETGIVTCTSEGPLDFRPYFSYQGYQVTEAGGEFVVDGRTDEQQTLLRSMGSRARMVSTKGCFLWHAARPGTYATLLYEHAREIARIEGLGFSSGIHEGTDRALVVSDVNTNGLILEAIAYIMNGRQPLSRLTRET